MKKSSFFSGRTKLRLARSLLTKNQPTYVQFYITARCNLACEQCNIIYSNADAQECTIGQIERIADNLAEIGVSVVLLTGGEPFARRDLPEIVKAFTKQGIHVRLQTNGLATRQALEKCVAAGAVDISISLDSLEPDTQDTINGEMKDSWARAIRTVSIVNDTFPDDAFAAFGCVLAPRNLAHVPQVLRFATEIGWWMSLVPAHVTPPSAPMGFRTYDKNLLFSPDQYPAVEAMLDSLHAAKAGGANLYDSKPYIDDILRMIRREPLQWRNRNAQVCDSPNLYFAIAPNGHMAVCCDLRMREAIPTDRPDFPARYRSLAVYQQAKEIAQACGGCMYGSFPEITISSRYFVPMAKRAWLFGFQSPKRRLKKFSESELFELADRIRNESAPPPSLGWSPAPAPELPA
jgi:MoaA/NifB/PqqE/SkfB family radical SAM enzyme